MATSSSDLPTLLLSSLNLLLLLLSAVSFAPLLLLRAPPSPFGWALFAVSSTTVLSSLLCFFSHLTHSFIIFIAHVSLLLLSSIGQALAFFSLFLRPDPSRGFLEPTRSPREVMVLTRMEEWAMVGMFAAGSVVLVLECMVQSWWVKECEEVEAAAAAKKRNQRTARVRVESVVESEGQEMEERMKGKCEQCVEV